MDQALSIPQRKPVGHLSPNKVSVLCWGPHRVRQAEEAGMAVESVAIVGGRVVPVTGDPIDGGTVLAEAGRITAVGTGPGRADSGRRHPGRPRSGCHPDRAARELLPDC